MRATHANAHQYPSTNTYVCILKLMHTHIYMDLKVHAFVCVFLAGVSKCTGRKYKYVWSKTIILTESACTEGKHTKSILTIKRTGYNIDEIVMQNRDKWHKVMQSEDRW